MKTGKKHPQIEDIKSQLLIFICNNGVNLLDFKKTPEWNFFVNDDPKNKEDFLKNYVKDIFFFTTQGKKTKKKGRKSLSEAKTNYNHVPFGLIIKNFSKKKGGYTLDGLKKILGKLEKEGVIKKFRLPPKKGDSKESRRSAYSVIINSPVFSKVIKICYEENRLNELFQTQYFKDYGYTYLISYLKEILGFDITDILDDYEVVYRKKTFKDTFPDGTKIKTKIDVPVDMYLTSKSLEEKKSFAMDYILELLFNSPTLINILISGSKKQKDNLKYISSLLRTKYKLENYAILDFLIMSCSVLDLVLLNNEKTFSDIHFEQKINFVFENIFKNFKALQGGK